MSRLWRSHSFGTGAEKPHWMNGVTSTANMPITMMPMSTFNIVSRCLNMYFPLPPSRLGFLMNLAKDNTKRLFRSLRTGGTPTSVGLWAAVNAVQQLRKRRKPSKVLLVQKDLEPGATYVIRLPQEGQAPISQTLSNGGIGSELVTTAASLFTSEEPVTEEPEPTEPEPTEPVPPSRRQRRRARRLERLERGTVDLSSVPRRRRRELSKAERKARRRPSRRRVKKARKLQGAAAKSLAKAERKRAPSGRAARKHLKQEKDLSDWERKNEKRSTRRRRRKLAVAKRRLKDD